MAISMTREMQDLKDRMYRAQHPDEHKYYADRLDELMKREYDRELYYDVSRAMMQSNLPIANTIGGTIGLGTISNKSTNPALAPVQDTTTPLSFLNKADKKLLLTGEVS